MVLQLPTVTVDDLRDFHAKHLPHAPEPEHIFHGVENELAEECYEEEEGGLGYYEDGTPRTLTDEQIAMFRHSEIQAIIRKRRQQRDNGNGSEEGEAEKSVTEDLANVDSPASQPTPTMATEAGKVASGRVEKLKSQQWKTSSPRTKAKNKRNRDKYKAKKRDKRLKREQARKNGRDEDEESDEWDPWHQAKGPDVQKDDTVDLDY
ncbi:hypothetical protein BU25DRAFT_425415 [Macroventuria anomochaeta]|uniref:Uncharacterized protein n=1 Tax=Macroventuria anomochaeta TaxID=301207 RepID=A0ACB6RNG2_9PLEO|nr:uncharacterized protein BU25DRAFT_425415 [Macroventuria anomochaeta]KAF2622694.1 hypothetical protein BU25DRAFT_425415 [Macroventuria anomochaeta]